jgi:hypothetical protein
VVHYGVGEYFDLHHDSSTKFQKRKITFLIYLNEVTEGGETFFPLLGGGTNVEDVDVEEDGDVDNKDKKIAKKSTVPMNQIIHEVLSSSAAAAVSSPSKGGKGGLESGLLVKPKLGSAVLFVNLNNKGDPIPKVSPTHRLTLCIILINYMLILCLVCVGGGGGVFYMIQ